MKTFITTILAVAVLALTVTRAATDQAREQKLQQAIDLIESKGDLAAATPLLEETAKSADRALAARGLLYLAQAQERYGKGDALATYQRIVNSFGGATEIAAAGAVAAVAQTRLAGMTQNGSGAVARQVQNFDFADFHVSPDGRYGSFTTSIGDLAVRDLASGRERSLTSCGTKDGCWADFGAFSPDSRFIAYDWTDEDDNQVELRVIGRDGGQPRVVYPNEKNADWVQAYGWSPDGKSILATRDHKDRTRDLMLIPASGGAARMVKHFEGTDASNFSMSPDGRSVAYDVPAAPGKPERDLVSVSLDIGREVPMLKHSADDYVLGWFPDGAPRILFASDRGGTYGIWAARVVDGRTQGEPMLIRSDTGHVRANGFTRKGDFYYSMAEVLREVHLATLDPTTGKQTGSLARLEGRYTGGMLAAAWSPDGDRMVYAQATTPAAVLLNPQFGGDGAGLNKKLAIQTISSSDLRLLPLALRNFENPVWLPDGRGVIVQGNNPEQGQGLFLVNIETGALTKILDQAGQPALSPDGRRVFYKSRGIAVRDLASGAEQTVTTQAFDQFALSPDGRWLAGTALNVDPNKPHVFVLPSSGGEPRPLAAISGRPLANGRLISAVAWSHDGRFVFVVVRVGNDGPDLVVRREIWQVPLDGTEPRNTGISFPHITRISAHPDGRRLALSTELNSSKTWILQNLPALREK